MRNPPRPEHMYRATEKRRRVNGSWRRDADLLKEHPALAQYLTYCRKHGLTPAEEAARFLIA